MHNFSLPIINGSHMFRLYKVAIVRLWKLRRMRWAGHVARMGERRGVYRVLVGRSEGKRPRGRLRPRWQDKY